MTACHVRVAEMRQGLDRGLHALACIARRHPARDRIAREGLAEDVHKGRVAGEERGDLAAGAEHRLQSAERLAGARNAGDEHDRLAAGSQALADRFAYRRLGGGQSLTVRQSLRQILHGIARVKAARGLHDAGHWPIGRVPPCRDVERRGWNRQRGPETAQQCAKARGIRRQWWRGGRQ